MASREDMSTSFGRMVGEYEAGRPGYPLAAVAWMLEPATITGNPLRAADVGAGTGKLTRVLAETGADVIAVDPDADMLAALRAELPDVPTLAGTAEQIPVPDGSLDAVVLGQAWHWVDPVAGSAEVGRTLRPGGVLGLVWNIRDDRAEWVARMTEIMHQSNAEIMMSEGGPRVTAPFGPLEEARFEWSRPMTADRLLAMARSRSYLITATADDRARIEGDLLDLFDELPELSSGGEIELPYVTRAFRAVRP
ncbi:class I SAM-dependent methyltransferase [Microbacterium rhizomatis]|uniref:Class I SAM-dependent methyltransferase n=1 Tax=Microbacterium rhizomatis TaxID=1631477 RepID=A0A5J5J3X0_9MICO|nr:class I SAM-dependent methyltransferase [Microbacterium rhizomatis]KAA9110149.1 class I SAM-dependent methyltransferase [Microbacterium rhizomatis]